MVYFTVFFVLPRMNMFLFFFFLPLHTINLNSLTLNSSHLLIGEDRDIIRKSKQGSQVLKTGNTGAGSSLPA